MKRSILIALAAFLVATALATSCSPTVTALNGSLGGTQAAETTALTNGSTTLKSVNGALTATPTFTLVNATGQIGYVDFNYPVDSATIATSVFLYNLTTAPDAYTRSPRGAALPYTTTIQGNRVYFTVDCSTATATVEAYINAATLTADGGSKKLDTNGNGIYGETGDDVSVAIAIGTAPGAAAPAAVATVLLPNPQATVNHAETGILGGNLVLDVATFTGLNVWTFTASDTGSAAAPNNNKVDVSTVATVYKNVDGVWTIAPSTTTYVAATNIATITLTTAPKKGESYKVSLDYYNAVETSAVLGYIHRGSYAKAHATTGLVNRYYTFTAAGGAQQDVTVGAVFGSGAAGAGLSPNGAMYFDVTIGGALSPIDLATLKPASFKVRLGTGATVSGVPTTSPMYTTYTVQARNTATFGTVANAVYVFRIYLPEYVTSAPGVNQIEIAPSVMSLASTTTALDTLSFGDIAGTDGWRIKAF